MAPGRIKGSLSNDKTKIRNNPPGFMTYRILLFTTKYNECFIANQDLPTDNLFTRGKFVQHSDIQITKFF